MEPTLPSDSSSPSLEECISLPHEALTDSASIAAISTEQHTHTDNHLDTLEKPTLMSQTNGLTTLTTEANVSEPVTPTLKTENNTSHSSLRPQESNSSNLGVLCESNVGLLYPPTSTSPSQEPDYSRSERESESHETVMEPAIHTIKIESNTGHSGTHQISTFSTSEALLSDSNGTARDPGTTTIANKQLELLSQFVVETAASSMATVQHNTLSGTRNADILYEAHTSRLKEMSGVAIGPARVKDNKLSETPQEDYSSKLGGLSEYHESPMDSDVSFMTVMSHPPDSVGFRSASEVVSQYYDPDSFMEVESKWTGSVQLSDPNSSPFSIPKADSLYFEATSAPASSIETDARIRQDTSSRMDEFSDPQMFEYPSSPKCSMIIDTNSSDEGQEAAQSSSKFCGFQKTNALSKTSQKGSAPSENLVFRNNQNEQTKRCYSECGEAATITRSRMFVHNNNEAEDVCLQDPGKSFSAEVCDPSSKMISAAQHTVNTISTSDEVIERDSNGETKYVKTTITSVTDIEEEEEEDAQLREYWTRALQTSTSTGEIVEEIVKVLKHHQKTHDLLCPVCGSCVTRRVILRKRKRSNFITVDRWYQDPLDDEIDVESENNLHVVEEENQVLQSTEAFGCLSCFSLFFHKGYGLLNQLKEDVGNCAFECLPFFFPPYPWGIIRTKPEKSGFSLVTTPEPRSKEDAKKKEHYVPPTEVHEVRSADIEQISSSATCVSDVLPDYPWGSCDAEIKEHYVPPKEVHEIRSCNIEQISRSATCVPDVLPDYPWGSCNAEIKEHYIPPTEVHEEIQSADIEQNSGTPTCVPDILPKYPWGTCDTEMKEHYIPPPKVEEEVQSAEIEQNSGTATCVSDILPKYPWGTCDAEMKEHYKPPPKVEEAIQSVDIEQNSGTATCVPDILPKYPWGTFDAEMKEHYESPTKVQEENSSDDNEQIRCLSSCVTNVLPNYPWGSCDADIQEHYVPPPEMQEDIQSADNEEISDSAICIPDVLPDFPWGSCDTEIKEHYVPPREVCEEIRSVDTKQISDSSSCVPDVILDYSCGSHEETSAVNKGSTSESKQWQTSEDKSCTCGLASALLPSSLASVTESEEPITFFGQETYPESKKAQDTSKLEGTKSSRQKEHDTQSPTHQSSNNENSCSCGLAPVLFPNYNWGSSQDIEESIPIPLSAQGTGSELIRDGDTAEDETFLRDKDLNFEPASDKNVESKELHGIETSNEERSCTCGLAPALLPNYTWGSSIKAEESVPKAFSVNGCESEAYRARDTAEKETSNIKPLLDANVGSQELQGTEPSYDERSCMCGLAPALLPKYSWGSNGTSEESVHKPFSVSECEPKANSVKDTTERKASNFDLQSVEKEELAGCELSDDQKTSTCGLAAALLPKYNWGYIQTVEEVAPTDPEENVNAEAQEMPFSSLDAKEIIPSSSGAIAAPGEAIANCSLGPALLPTYPWGSDITLKDEPEGSDLIPAYISDSVKHQELFADRRDVTQNIGTLLPSSEQRINSCDLISTLLPNYPWGSVPRIEDEEENTVEQSYVDLPGSPEEDDHTQKSDICEVSGGKSETNLHGSAEKDDHTQKSNICEVSGGKSKTNTSLSYEEDKLKSKRLAEDMAIEIESRDEIKPDMFGSCIDGKTEVQMPVSEHSIEIEEHVSNQLSTEILTRPSDEESITAPLLDRTFQAVRINPDAGTWEILKPIVYGGLDISIASLGVTSSAAGGNATTRTVVYMGLSTLLSGLVLFYQNVMHLYKDHNDHYQAVVGLKLLLHGTVALISYLVFGVLSPLIYGLSYRETDDRDHKFILCCVVVLVCVILLSLGKAKVSSKKYIKTLITYVFVGVLSSVVGYLAGEHVSELLESWGL